jgi:hypothetical protein
MLNYDSSLLETIAEAIWWPIQRQFTRRIESVWSWSRGLVLGLRPVLRLRLRLGLVLLLGLILWLILLLGLVLWLGPRLGLGLVLRLRSILRLVLVAVLRGVVLRKRLVLGLRSDRQGGGCRLRDSISGGLESVFASRVAHSVSLACWVYVRVTSTTGTISVTFFFELYTVFLWILSAEFAVSAQISLLVEDGSGLGVASVGLSEDGSHEGG